MLKFGSKGNDVRELQTFLAAEGYDVGALDGVFGAKTRTAVRKFQSDQGITVDGVVGAITQGKIDTFGIASVVDIENAEPDIQDDIILPEGQVLSDEEGGEDIFGVMAGGTIHRVDNPAGQEDFYVIAYEYPPGSGHSFYYRFDSLKSLEQAVGPSMGNGAVTVGDIISEASLSQWTDGGNAQEIVGIKGTFDGYMADLMREAVELAGFDDPTLAGAALEDPGIRLVYLKAAEGKWNRLQIKAALRKEPYYQDVLYPGIKNFYAQTDNPEELYAMYRQNVEASLKMLGIARDPDGGYGSQIASLLDKGVSDIAFAKFVTTYSQAQTNIGFADALSKWTERFTGIAITTFEDYFDVLALNAPAEVLEIAEIAGLQYMADNAGFIISDQELRNLGEALDMTQAEGGELFSNTARKLLALGERGLRRGNLTSQQVLEAEAGIGGNVENIRSLMRKLAIEEGISDDPQATIFTDFNREGAPIKKGLQSSISEGA